MLYNLKPNLKNGSEDDRRTLHRMAVEQYIYEGGLKKWGLKSRDVSAPQGKDAIAYRLDEGTGSGQNVPMSIWDVQNGSTRELAVRSEDEPTYGRIGDQYFIEIAQGVNHLGVVAPGNPDTPPAGVDLRSIMDKLAQMSAQMIAIESKIDALPKTSLTAEDLKGLSDQIAGLSGQTQEVLRRQDRTLAGRVAGIANVSMKPVGD